MRKKKILYRMLIVIVSAVIISFFYLNTNYFIRGQEWKHRDGSSVGDWIEFDDTLYAVRARTIYKKNAASAKVIFCFGKMLIIKQIATGEKGYYVNKTRFKF
jgi:hypothetical protein